MKLQEELPFVVTPDGRKLLYLWPLLLQRRSECAGRRTLWVFEGIPDDRRPFLTTIRTAAIEVPEGWSPNLHDPSGNHNWLLKHVPGRSSAVESRQAADRRLRSCFGTISRQSR